jgi:hypothetical protein
MKRIVFAVAMLAALCFAATPASADHYHHGGNHCGRNYSAYRGGYGAYPGYHQNRIQLYYGAPAYIRGGYGAGYGGYGAYPGAYGGYGGCGNGFGVQTRGFGFYFGN